jgi:hypothetical protein
MSNDSPTGRAEELTRKERLELEHRRRWMSRNPFSPDHRDKVQGLSCRQCEIERLTRLAGTPPMVVEAPEDPYQERRNIERSQAQGARSDEPKFESLLDTYWSLAYAEGKEGRDHDTEDGKAGQTRHELSQLFRGRGSADTEDALTDEQIAELWVKSGEGRWPTTSPRYLRFARALAKKP